MAPSAKRILIAPLDWGLGHTTRCVPIIRALYSMGHQVVFAGNMAQQAFIRRTFPDIDIKSLQGYRVRYSRWALMFTILWQIPRLLNIVKGEHIWLRRLVDGERIDGIISDNRYGLWHRDIPSVIITHQPRVMSGAGRAVDNFIQKLHHKYLGRFGQVWIPDLSGEENLAGELSHPGILPEGTNYIGWLSQFDPGTQETAGEGHMLVLLSGPEPQRTILANNLWKQVQSLEKPVVFVEGREGIYREDILPHIRHISLASARELEPLLKEASIVVCRSGYSTLMDLATVGKPAVLIPTPGQTEQEYLATYLSKRGVFHTVEQRKVDLARDIVIGLHKPGIEVPTSQELLISVLSKWVTSL